MENVQRRPALDFKGWVPVTVMFLALCTLALTGRAKIAEQEDIPGLPSIAPQEFDAVRADIVNDEGGVIVFNVRKFANIGVDETAPFFAVYTGKSLPAKCGDVRNLDLSYWSPSRYRRAFDVGGAPEFRQALDGYGCAVIRNMRAANNG
jgi:hypothetical protein